MRPPFDRIGDDPGRHDALRHAPAREPGGHEQTPPERRLPYEGQAVRRLVIVRRPVTNDFALAEQSGDRRNEVRVRLALVVDRGDPYSLPAGYPGSARVLRGAK